MYTPAVPVESRTWRHWTITTYEALISPAGALMISNANSLASQAWPLANLALYVPILVNETCTVYEAGIGTGATAGGNFDIGIYRMDGTKVVSSGTTVRTASAWNVAGLADTELTPGWYYAAMSADATSNYSGSVPGAGLCESVGIVEQTSAFVLPSPATLSTRTTRTLVPMIAFAVRSLAL